MQPRLLIVPAAMLALLIGCQTSKTDPNVCPDEPAETRDLYEGLLPTKLAADCRCTDQYFHHVLCISRSQTEAALGQPFELGTGPRLSEQGSAPELRYGDYWPDRGEKGVVITAMSTYTKAPGLVVEVDLATANRRVVSGTVIDPATGPTMVGAGPDFGDPGYAYRGPDDMIYVYSRDDVQLTGIITRVDPETGDRTLIWRRGVDNGFGQCMNGVPEDGNASYTPPDAMQLQLEGEGFAIASDGGFYLTTVQNGFPAPGNALIKVSADGLRCDVVTMGVPEANNLYPAEGIGGGWPLDYQIREVKELNGRLFINSQHQLLEVDKVTGDRTKISINEGSPVGEMAWDHVRDMMYITGVKNPYDPNLYWYDLEDDKLWKQIGCAPTVVEAGHPYAEPDACISTSAVPFGSISEGQSWMTESGDYMVAAVGTNFLVVELATGNSNNFSF